jgi:hypothetical protein
MKERPVPDRGVLVLPNDLAVLDAEASVTGQLGQALHRPGSVPSPRKCTIDAVFVEDAEQRSRGQLRVVPHADP